MITGLLDRTQQSTKMWPFSGFSRWPDELPQAPAPNPEPKPPVQRVTTAATIPEEDHSIFSRRSMRQLGLFFAGAGFFTLTTLVTRRSISRKQIAAQLKFYQPSHRSPTAAPEKNPEGSFIAVEALNLATMNVLSFFMMLTGGTMFALDISGIEDLRRMARKHIGPAGGRTDEEAEEEVQEWVASVLQRKDLMKDLKKDKDGTNPVTPKP